MHPKSNTPLPAVLADAAMRLRATAAAAVERSIESLGLSALTASSSNKRDELLAAQQALNRGAQAFVRAFEAAHEQQVQRHVGETARPEPTGNTAWDALRLVDDSEIETQIAADRFVLDVSTSCEWELRELDGFVATLLDVTTTDDWANPLRPAPMGLALIQAVAATTDRPTLRRHLATEVGRSLTSILRDTYGELLKRLRRLGVQPQAMSARQRPSGHAPGGGGRGTPPAAAHYGAAATVDASVAPRLDRRQAQIEGSAGARPAGPHDPASIAGPAAPDSAGGGVNVQMADLIQRIAHTTASIRAAQARPTSGAPTTAHPAGAHASVIRAPSAPDWADGLPSPANVILQHREELAAAARGGVDLEVIDAVGAIFEHILADRSIAPQLARQLARLQMPVLRTALADPGFFASRRHPVRRFVNRIASLGAGFEDYQHERAQTFLALVERLVEDVLVGDLANMAVYEAGLERLERDAASLAMAEVAASGVATQQLTEKERELRLRALYSRRLRQELDGLSVPPFLQEFLSGAWSQVILNLANDPRGVEGADGHEAHAQHLARMRRVPRDLCLSVQPKPTQQHRQLFLDGLPQLMQALTEGLQLIDWPDPEQRAFFAQLMPEHAQALRALGGRQLDLNLMARQVDGAFAQKAPNVNDVPNSSMPMLLEDIERARLSVQEARRMGIAEESDLIWERPVAPGVDRLEAQRTLSDAARLPLGSLQMPTNVSAPTVGRALADHVQVGYVYELHLQGAWLKHKLSFMSPGRTFFVFTRGKDPSRPLSLTYRMLARLCETHRLRPFEGAYLLERATAKVQMHMASKGMNRTLAESTAGPLTISPPLGAPKPAQP